MQEQDVAKQIIGEASAKLSRALPKNDLTDAKVAQVMLSLGNTMLQETSQQLTKIREDKEQLRKKLSDLQQQHKADDKLNPPLAKKTTKK